MRVLNRLGQNLLDLEILSINQEMKLSKNKQQQMQFRITPDHFNMFKTGRKINDFKMEAVAFKSGMIWRELEQSFGRV